MSLIETLRSLLDLPLGDEAHERIDQNIRFLERVLQDEQTFQHLGSRLDCGLLVVDERGVVTYINDRLADLFRAPRSTLVGQFVASWLEGDAKATFFRQFSQRRRGVSSPYSLRAQRADRTSTVVSVIPFPRFDEQGTFRGTFAMLFEIGSDPTAHMLEMVPHTERPPENSDRMLDELSPRERQIVDTLMAGQDVGNVAQTFHISEHTVRNHIKSIYRKLGVHSRAELIRRILNT
ncbi:MAG: PAS domain-containing protein [Deltaproteobacteria bacterium]|nr:PAS domain-containing protein [Deltaproteobacteria bacterium]